MSKLLNVKSLLLFLALAAVGGCGGSSGGGDSTPPPTTGSLQVTVSGLPNGVNANVTVTGPGSYSQAVTASTTLSNLTPGSYTVNASNVTSGAITYNATVTGSPATVVAGQTATATVGYVSAGTPVGVWNNPAHTWSNTKWGP